MHTWDRRTLLRALFGLPLLSLADLSYAQTVTDDNPLMWGVRIFRLINTVEAWNKRKSGRFATIAELPGTEAVKALRADAIAEKIGIGKTLYDSLSLKEHEIFPGWKVKLALSDGHLGYVAVMEDVRTGAGTSLVTDERGIIYKSQSLAAAFDDEPTSIKHMVRSYSRFGNGKAAVQKAAARIGSTILPFMFFQCYSCSGTGCVCCWSCQGFVPPGCHQFYNCGCPGCPWCVCPWCSGCPLPP